MIEKGPHLSGRLGAGTEVLDALAVLLCSALGVSQLLATVTLQH